ncbi:metalloregulator ArsR/SmtB family transcription factor [Rhodococcus zopfii]|uniref:Metalloregulator ArsR/SmtB family transcription factor n=1 Tax=Rhodococcus zopfii TaxID=43772 RepID=A0ABU3WQW1_9NOCA|nr:metalloregulator ArsR/SmtB family transcription factor [Rhodococcus zopfii]
MEPGNSEEMDKSSVFEALAKVVKAVANGRRLELIELLAQGEHAVDALARMSGMGVTTTSAHLQTMKQAGLVKTRRERTTIYYRLAGDDVAELYLAAKRVGLQRYPVLRQSLVEYMGEADGSCTPTIDPSAVTSDMTVVDVRPRAEFDAGHFPGAVSIPLAELEARFHEIPPGAEVVLYCRGELCRLARDAARWLCERGVDAKAMDEGVVEWRASKEVDLGVA